ncbi:hypothetical protein FSP39_017178 [Pinctada imbricata]|uniref:Uncharacterized protein n=1 Tax=Pinctada imbricata TaxID=66713 RepID=A0AA89C5K5_PINIB|nr:hypothetical protein FSP39_017178 [Pinctada imbricata]
MTSRGMGILFTSLRMFLRRTIRKQANNYVVTYGKHKKVQSFLGVHMLSNKQMPGHVRKLTRSTSRKPKNDRSLLDSLELLMIDTLLGGNISLQDQVKFHECKECLAGDGEYAKIGNFVLYRKHEQIYIGSLKKVVVLQSKQEMTTVAFVKRGECTTDIQKNCQKVQESDRTEAVKTTDILNAVHTIHDCKGGYCRIAENQSGQYLKHSSHPVHIINKFRLSKLPDTLTDI